MKCPHCDFYAPVKSLTEDHIAREHPTLTADA